jgi:hypothetical protein
LSLCSGNLFFSPGTIGKNTTPKEAGTNID